MQLRAPRLSISGNSSKVESVGRALVASVFLVALWLDPVEPVRDDLAGDALLASYLVWSIGLIAIAWRSWWWDHRLARAAHALDIAVFVAAVYYTEAPSTDFSSPFMAFAVLLLIKARIRWDWRMTAATALVLLVLNLAIAGTMAWTGYAIDLNRVGRRAAYMMLLAVLVVWMGLERQVMLALHFPVLPPQPLDPRPARRDAAQADNHPLMPLIAVALRFARGATGAGHAAIAWSAEQEPWIDLGVENAEPGANSGAEQAFVPPGVRIARLGPDALVDQAEPAGPAHMQALLFDSARRRALLFGPGGQRTAVPLDRAPPLAARLGVETGISVAISSDAGDGRLLLWDLADPCFDRLSLARQAAGEIGRAFEREERARLAQALAVSGAVAGAVSGVREAIARDLHDSAAQFLAGTMFRLEALRRRLGDQETHAGAEIVAIKDAMRSEQVELRELIGQLRRGETADRQTDLARELAALLSELGAHWHLTAALVDGGDPIMVPVSLSHEVRQLVREGVANAARHGGGDRVAVDLAEADAWLTLAITDNGRGFPADEPGAPGVRPSSIAGRVAALGGSLAVAAVEPHGARLSIALPLRPIRAKEASFRESLAAQA